MQNLKLGALALAAAVLFVLAPHSVSAAPIVPTYTSFGTLSSATFGGDGIPNDAVAVSVYAANSGTVTLGLTAHQRYDNIAVGNDGAGTFFAAVGPDAATGGNAMPGYATWNLGFYFHDSDPNSGNTFSVFWDFDPAFDNDRSTHGALEGWTLPANPHQDSLNLGMDHLTWFATTPPTGTFNPNVDGWYTFSAQAFNSAGTLLAESAIRVQVGNPVPEPALLTLLGFGLVVGGARLRRRG